MSSTVELSAGVHSEVKRSSSVELLLRVIRGGLSVIGVLSVGVQKEVLVP